MTRNEILADMKAGSPAFCAWVLEQTGEYYYDLPHSCAFARFLQAQGFKFPSVGGRAFSFHEDEPAENSLSYELVHALVAEPHTFEALAERLA